MSYELVILVLLILGLAFMALEAVAPAFGLLGLGGIGSFLAALFMMNNLETFYGMEVQTPVLVALGIIGIVVLTAIIYFTKVALKTKISAGAEILKGHDATVLAWEGTNGRIHVDGETWSATGPAGIADGDTVTITGREQLTLTVIKKES